MTERQMSRKVLRNSRPLASCRKCGHGCFKAGTRHKWIKKNGWNNQNLMKFDVCSHLLLLQPHFQVNLKEGSEFMVT